MEHYKKAKQVHSVEQGSLILVNDEKLKDPTNMAKAFNNFIITITEKLNIQQIQQGDAISILKDSFPRNIPSIKIIPITETEMKSVIHFLTPKKSPDYNEITSKILHACPSLTSHPLSYIYCHSLYSGIFPDSLKIAVVKPLYRKGDKTNMTHYRPIHY